MHEHERTTDRVDTRLGPLAVRSTGTGPTLVFFAGAMANGDLWRDVVAALDDRYRCITIDLPLGAHRWPMDAGADRSAASLATLLVECVERLDLHEATLVANDTAGGLLLLALASGHPALDRVGRLVLTNCDSYDQFPPDALRAAASLCRRLPRVGRALVRLQVRSSRLARKLLGGVSARGVDAERAAAFLGPARRDPRIAGDLVAAMGSFHPEVLLDAAPAIEAFDRPVLLVWGDACDFFPLAHAARLEAHFPDATLVTVEGARTWVPIDDPVAVAGAIERFVPAP